MMEVGADIDWQLGKNVLQCNRHMLENELHCDVTFLVGPEDNEAKIGAHKYVLASRSPVFCAMLYGGLATDDAIKVSDIDPDIFRSMLRFIYFEEDVITMQNFVGILYVAKKYFLAKLSDLCTKFLTPVLSVDNVCEVLNQTNMFSDAELERICFTFICKKAGEIFDSDGFLSLTHESLIKVLTMEEMLCDEVAVFKACDRWSEAECARRNLDPTGFNKREVLGDAVKLIRFPTMTLADFADHVSKREILSPDEEVNIYRFFTAGERPNPGFNTSRRSFGRVFTCSRFQGVSRSWNCSGRYEDALDFKTTRDIFLCGVGFYCGAKGLNCHVIVKEQERQIAEITKNIPEKEPSKETGDTIHDVTFPQMLKVKAGVWYTISARLKGEPTLRGVNGIDYVHVPEVNVGFNLQTCDESTNGTDTRKGQIPRILFHPC